MTTIIFNGKVEANKRAQVLRNQVLKSPKQPTIASVFFAEDEGSVLYTCLKKEAALRAGMRFNEHAFRIAEADLTKPLDCIATLSRDPAVAGIIVQKPTQAVWNAAYRGNDTFETWWQQLVVAIPLAKDIDGLTPACLDDIRSGRWTILPATVKAVLLTLQYALPAGVSDQRTIVVGCSDIIGLPLADAMRHLGAQVTLICNNVGPDQLKEADIIISATGTPNIITGDMVKEGVIAIDVGAPKADIHFASVAPKAKFITPVPGGIGPLTVVSLLENTIELSKVARTH